MKPIVMQSYEDDTGTRCVDIRRHDDGRWSWSECRKDPEDGHGWRHLDGAGGDLFDSEHAAFSDALTHVDWLTPPRDG
ncbi:MAG: hypothetical protein AAGP08_02375 [Pseudomonadota bacterium]